jgi:hypothetical protein
MCSRLQVCLRLLHSIELQCVCEDVDKSWMASQSSEHNLTWCADLQEILDSPAAVAAFNGRHAAAAHCGVPLRAASAAITALLIIACGTVMHAGGPAIHVDTLAMC